jgi:protein-disulfide isomerase/uncharacterized membrane protein
MSDRVKKILPVVILALIGLGISVAIESVHRRLAADVSYTSFCNVSATVNCDVVLGSRYATLAGFSVSTWAILFYLAILAVAVGAAKAQRATLRGTLATVLLGMAVWGLLFALYMAGVAFGVLHTVCMMCSGLYVVSIGLVLASWRLRGDLRLRGRRQVAARAGENRLLMVGALVAVLALLAVGSWEALGRGTQMLDAAEIQRQRPDFYRWYFAQPLTQLRLDDSRHARGNADAPVTIVEFSDFECAHCAAFHESLEDVLHRVGPSVRVVFHHFPLSSACNPKVPTDAHPEACLAAVAAECAGDQGKFWQYHNLLFDNQQELQRQFLIGYATRLGLDVARFTQCLGSEEARSRVDRDARDGAALGIDSTPTLFINGRTIKGALDAQRLVDAIVLGRPKS